MLFSPSIMAFTMTTSPIFFQEEYSTSFCYGWKKGGAETPESVADRTKDILVK